MFNITRVRYKLPARALLLALALLATALATVTASPPARPEHGLVPVAPSLLSELALADMDQPDPLVEEMLGQVDQATLRQYEEWLTGEEAVQIGGQPFILSTRYTYSGKYIQKATQFAYEHLDAVGLDVVYHQWKDETYPNVIATKVGLLNPKEIYILSAHLDNMPLTPVAPGADDNASGSTGLLMAADILSQYDFGCTLKFALWTGEEQGMRGSAAWADWARDQGLDIRGVLNMDMIAYNSDDSPAIDLHARESVTGSVQMAVLFAEVVDAYELDLEPEVLLDDPLGNRSDNASFWDDGYPALLAVEDDADFNPNYHTVNDKLSALDLTYMAEVIRSSIATFVHAGDCLLPGGVGYLDGHVTRASGHIGTGVPLAGAMVTMRNNVGQTFQAVTGASGYYTRLLPAGVYTVTASAGGTPPATRTGVTVRPDAVTTQDFVLETIPERNWSLYLPLLSNNNSRLGEDVQSNFMPPATSAASWGKGQTAVEEAVSYPYEQGLQTPLSSSARMRAAAFLSSGSLLLPHFGL